MCFTAIKFWNLVIIYFSHVTSHLWSGTSSFMEYSKRDTLPSLEKNFPESQIHVSVVSIDSLCVMSTKSLFTCYGENRAIRHNKSPKDQSHLIRDILTVLFGIVYQRYNIRINSLMACANGLAQGRVSYNFLCF